MRHKREKEKKGEKKLRMRLSVLLVCWFAGCGGGGEGGFFSSLSFLSCSG